MGVWHAGSGWYKDGKRFEPVEPPYDPAGCYFYRDERVAESFERMESEAGAGPAGILRDRHRLTVYGGMSDGCEEWILRGSGRGIEVSELEFDFPWRNGDPTIIQVHELRSGWPLRCLWSVGHEASYEWGFYYLPRWAPYPCQDPHAFPRWLPCRPDLLGLAGDAAVHGAVICGVVVAGLGVRAARRRRAGRCAACAYDRRGLGESDPCPECGAHGG